MRVVASMVVAAGLFLGQPTVVRAQMVDTSDPCFDVLFSGKGVAGGMFRKLLETGSRNNRDQVELVAAEFRQFLDAEVQSIQKTLDELKSDPPSNAVITRLRSWYGCLPWLKRQLAVVEGDLKRLGISTIQMPQDRHRVERDTLIRDAIDDIEAIERLLGPVVKRRAARPDLLLD